MKNFLYPEWVPAAVGGAQARPAGPLARRADGGVRDCARQGRDIAATAKLALDATGRLLALDVAMVANLGAYLSAQRPRRLGRRRIDGAGRRLRHSRGIASTCAAPSPIRCRSMPIAAPASPRPTTSSSAPSKPRRCQLGRDPAELRRQNLIASFPHKTAMGMAIDSGGFVANLDAAVARADTAGFAARRAGVASEAAGCAASASAASSKPRAARPTRAPRCASKATAR